MAEKPFFFDVPKISNVTIVNADGGVLKTLVTGAASGTKVTGIILSSDDSSPRDVWIGITSGGPNYPIGTVTVPANAGTVAAVGSVNGLDRAKMPGLPVDSDGNPYIFLESGDTLQIKALVTVTATKTIYATAVHGDDA